MPSTKATTKSKVTKRTTKKVTEKKRSCKDLFEGMNWSFTRSSLMTRTFCTE